MLVSRLQSFLRRLSWYKNLKKSPLHAFCDLVAIKFSPDKNFRAIFGSQPFVFTRKDMSALNEVLVCGEYNFLKKLISSEETQPIIVDIGANIGTFALWILNLNPNAQVFSIEASPKNFKTLVQNKQLHQNGSNWECMNFAAWKTDDIIGFCEDGDSMSFKVNDSSSTTVQALSLKSLLLKINQCSQKNYIDVMKIDIEGAEEAFLADTSENAAALQNVKNLVIELHPNYCNSDVVYAFLKKSFAKVEEQQDRETRKPLLLCQH